jgi:hypothetical protein
MITTDYYLHDLMLLSKFVANEYSNFGHIITMNLHSHKTYSQIWTWIFPI